MCALLLYFPLPTAQEILMTSYQDIMNVCSDFPSGKPAVHVHQNCHGLTAHLPVSMPEPQILQKLQTSLSLS